MNAIVKLQLCLAAVSCLHCPGAIAAEAQADYASRLIIQADGRHPLYRVLLSRQVYRGMAGPGLADLRVFNGAGEVVPHAIFPRSPGSARPAPAVKLKVFALPDEAAGTGDGKSAPHVRIETDAAGAVIRINAIRPEAKAGPGHGAYLLDASGVNEALKAINLQINAYGDFSGKARLEAGNDLAAWREVAAGAPLLRLNQGGENLEQVRIEFSAQKARYFRLSWTGMPAAVELAGASGTTDPAAGTRIEPEHQWERVTGNAVAGKPGEYEFDSQGIFPADRLRLELPQRNTVAPVQLSSRARPSDPWRPVARTIAYRLTDGERDTGTPDLEMAANTHRHWLLRVDQRSGGLGAGSPQLLLGWVPAEIAFAARGGPPYALAFGRNGASPALLPVESLIPGYRADMARDGAVAGALVPESVPLIEDGSLQGAPGNRPAEPAVNIRQWSLWGVLCLGVLVLGVMAWRLMRQMNSPQAK